MTVQPINREAHFDRGEPSNAASSVSRAALQAPVPVRRPSQPTPHRAPDYDYAIMSWLVYTDAPQWDMLNTPEIDAQTRSDDWQRRGWTCFNTVENDRSGYRGAAFVNKEKGHIVIAHRGTASFAGAMTSLEGVHEEYFVRQQADSWKFVQQVVADHPRYQVSFAGHSLARVYELFSGI